VVAKLESLGNRSSSTAAEPISRRPASVSTLLRAVRILLDTQKALARVDGNHAMYRRLLARFLDAHASSANAIRDSSRAPKCAIVRHVVTESSEAYELSNVVETALARALVLAAEAGRWVVVMQIAEELQGRRVSARTVPRATEASG
jgi:hypothetical protein